MTENTFPTVFDALDALNVEGFSVSGEPTNEAEFLVMFTKYEAVNGVAVKAEHNVSWSDVAAKKAELVAAQEEADVRYKRDQLIAATDWWVLGDRTATQAQLDYRQALRNVPQQETFPIVTWPDVPA